MIHFTVLGSGSSGNCAVVSDGEVTVLVDAGLSARQMRVRLEAAGYALSDLSGILLTHEHGDHVRGLEVFCRHCPVPVYCTPLTRDCVAEGVRSPARWKLLAGDGEFRLGPRLVVRSFPVPHDAVDPVGFVFEDGESRLGLVSDVGYVTHVMRQHLRGSTALFIEANYDEAMLQNDVKRPWATKQRIAARHGHLSNDQAAELLREVATDRLHRVVLGHLSEDCNDPVLARDCIRDTLSGLGLAKVDVACALRDRPTERFPAASPSGLEERGAERPRSEMPMPKEGPGPEREGGRRSMPSVPVVAESPRPSGSAAQYEWAF